MENVKNAMRDDTALHAEIDRLKSDLRQLRADLSDLAGDAVNTVKAGAAQARGKVDRSVKSAAEQGREALEAVEDQVSLHPIMSLATALTVGFVVGLALSRKG